MVFNKVRAPPILVPTLFSKREEEKTTREIEDIKVHCTSFIRPVVQEMAVFYNDYIACNGNEIDGSSKTLIQIIALVIDERRGGD